MTRHQGWRWTMIGLFLSAGCATIKPPLQPAAPSPPPAVRAQAELPPDRAAQVCLAAAQEMEANDHEAQAIVEYERARQNNPRLTGVAHRLALLYDRQGDSERALAEYQRALAEKPRDPDLLNDMGNYYYEHGRWVESEQWLRKALTANPGHTRAWVNLGKVLGQQGRYDESFEAFCKVLSPAQAHSNVGVLLAKQGKLAEARLAFHRALALQPDLKQPRAILRVLESPALAGGGKPPETAARAEPDGPLLVATKQAGNPSRP